MPKASKFSPDEGLTIYDLKDNDAVHWADNTKIGAHNLCPYPFKQGSATNRGVTFTDNGNGTLTLNNANDNTGDSVYQMHGAWASTKLILPPGVYTVTTGNANANIYMSFSYNETNLGSTLNGNKTINAPNGITYIVCSVKKGVTVTNETVYPLIRYSFDTDDTYAPYVMTNRELTNDKLDTKVLSSKIEDNTTSSSAYLLGDRFIYNGQFCIAKTDIAIGDTFVLNTNYLISHINDVLPSYWYNKMFSGVSMADIFAEIKHGRPQGFALFSFVNCTGLSSIVSGFAIMMWDNNLSNSKAQVLAFFQDKVETAYVGS